MTELLRYNNLITRIDMHPVHETWLSSAQLISLNVGSGRVDRY